MEEALQGARDIIAERISETAANRETLRSIYRTRRVESKATKAGSITVNSWLDIPFVYKKGDVISIDRTLSELGLSGVVLSSLGKSFKVEVEVDSYLPFVVTSQAEAGETVKAKLDTPLAAGTPSSAKRTNAVISVESSTAIDSISDAVIHLQLTAEEGARLTRDCKLVIHYKTLNIK